jgi:ParB-like chromosome segregation protein Spo0J
MRRDWDSAKSWLPNDSRIVRKEIDVQIRDRIKELRRVPAASLRPSPHNWRTHPPAQADALRGVLADVGLAAAALARELPDGTLELIDGHLRAETLGNEDIPVLVLDVDEAEAKKLLATFDPLGAMADADSERLASLLQEVETDNDALAGMLADLAKEHSLDIAEEPAPAEPPSVPEKYQILIDFPDEPTQAEWLEKLSAEGLSVRSLIS